MVCAAIPSRSSAAEGRLYKKAQHPWRVTFIVNNPRVWTRVSWQKTLLDGKNLLFAGSLLYVYCFRFYGNHTQKMESHKKDQTGECHSSILQFYLVTLMPGLRVGGFTTSRTTGVHILNLLVHCMVFLN